MGRRILGKGRAMSDSILLNNLLVLSTIIIVFGMINKETEIWRKSDKFGEVFGAFPV